MADLPEVGVSPGPPKRKRVKVDPITLRVLGGAFDAIAQEMAGVLFRMAAANPHRRRERGSLAPNAGRSGNRSRKPNIPRANAVKAGVVCRSAVSVTLNAAPQKTIVKSSSSGTGMRAPNPLTDG